MKCYVWLFLLIAVVGCTSRTKEPSTPEEKTKAVVAEWLDIAKTANGDVSKSKHLTTVFQRPQQETDDERQSRQVLWEGFHRRLDNGELSFPKELHAWKFYGQNEVKQENGKNKAYIRVMADYHDARGVRVSNELVFFVNEQDNGKYLIDGWVRVEK